MNRSITPELPVGKYRVLTESKFYPDAIDICKIERGNRWVRFYKDGKELCGCNAIYAMANFKFERMEEA